MVILPWVVSNRFCLQWWHYLLQLTVTRYEVTNYYTQTLPVTFSSVNCSVLCTRNQCEITVTAITELGKVKFNMHNNSAESRVVYGILGISCGY